MLSWRTMTTHTLVQTATINAYADLLFIDHWELLRPAGWRWWWSLLSWRTMAIGWLGDHTSLYILYILYISYIVYICCMYWVRGQWQLRWNTNTNTNTYTNTMAIEVTGREWETTHHIYRVFFLTGPTQKVQSIRLHSKSHQKSSKCQNLLTDWHLELFV